MQNTHDLLVGTLSIGIPSLLRQGYYKYGNLILTTNKTISSPLNLAYGNNVDRTGCYPLQFLSSKDNTLFDPSTS